MSGFWPDGNAEPERQGEDDGMGAAGAPAFVVGSRVQIVRGARRGHAGWIFAPFSSSQATRLKWEIELDNGCHTVVAESDISHV